MSLSAQEAGPAVEKRICQLRGFDRVGDDENAPDWVDAYSPAGDELEIKAARYEKSNGANETTSGQFWIGRKNHRQLRDAGGLYCLVVYQVDGTDVELVHVAIVPAQFLDPLIPSWTNVGRTSKSTSEKMAQFSWKRVFSDGGETRV